MTPRPAASQPRVRRGVPAGDRALAASIPTRHAAMLRCVDAMYAGLRATTLRSQAHFSARRCRRAVARPHIGVPARQSARAGHASR